MDAWQDEVSSSGLWRWSRSISIGRRPCCATNKVSGQGRAAGNAISKDVHARETHSTHLLHMPTPLGAVHHSPSSRTTPFVSVLPPRTPPPFCCTRVQNTRAASLSAVETGPALPLPKSKIAKHWVPQLSLSLSLYLCIDFAHAQKLESSFLFAQVFRAL